VPLISLVDENDSVVGSADYEVIHRNGLLHRFVLVYIFDKEGRLFLQRRSSNKAHGGLLAESLCAHVREGEDYVQTARRRMREELGLSSERIVLHEVTKLHVYTEEPDWKNNAFAKIYDCEIDASPIINKSEVKEGFFVPIESVKKRFQMNPTGFVPGFKTTFEAYLRSKQIF
jgi:isopentenyl-diphosphate delta-isomerase